MSHETDPTGLRGDGQSTPEDPAAQGPLGRLVVHFSEWPRRYVEMRIDVLDPDR